MKITTPKVYASIEDPVASYHPGAGVLARPIYFNPTGALVSGGAVVGYVFGLTDAGLDMLSDAFDAYNAKRTADAAAPAPIAAPVKDAAAV